MPSSDPNSRRCRDCLYWIKHNDQIGECGLTDDTKHESTISVQLYGRDGDHPHMWSKLNHPALHGVLVTPADFGCTLFESREEYDPLEEA